MTNDNNNCKNVIFCYSATGNSLASAKQLSEKFDMPVRFIDAETVIRKEKIACDFCIIIFPTFAYAPPPLVRKFFQACSFNVGYLAVLSTCGTACLGALSESIRLLKRKKQKVHYVGGIKSVENYVHIFGFSSENKIDRRLKNQKEITEQIGNDLEQRVLKGKRTFAPISKIVSCLFKTFKPLLVKFYRVKKTCNGCGLCSRVCPALAIKMQEKKGRTVPVFSARKCDHCQACMQLCPQKAIKFMRVRPSSKRYIHKDITVSELIKRDRDF